MATTLKEVAGALAGSTLISTELASLVNNAGSALPSTATIPNQTNLDLEGQAELVVTFAAAPTADSTVDLYLIPALDGTNYADYTSGTSPVVSLNHYAGAFVLKAVTTAQRVTTRRFSLAPVLYKPVIVNKSGQTFPASGSSIRFWTYNLQSI